MGTQGCCGSRVCMIMTTRSTLNAHNIHSCTQFGVGKLEVGCKAPSMTQSTPNFQCTEYTIANQFRTFLRKREHQNTPVCPCLILSTPGSRCCQSNCAATRPQQRTAHQRNGPRRRDQPARTLKVKTPKLVNSSIRQLCRQRLKP